MKRILCGLLSGLLAAVLLCPPVWAQQRPTELHAEYALAAVAGRLELWADPGTGNFCLLDKQTGALWNSAPLQAQQDETMKGAVKNRLLSFVTGSLLDPELGKETPFYSGVLAGQGKLEYIPIANGYRLKVDAPQVSFYVEVLLEEDHVILRLPTEGIEEDAVWLQNVQLAPSLGAGSKEDEGFLLVPDGCGAVIHFNNGKKGSYDEPIYGVDKAVLRTALAVNKQTAALPVYGIEKNGVGLLAVISQGAAVASVQAATSRNGSVYNTACASFTLREKASQSITQDVSQTIYEQERSVNQELELRLYPVQESGSGYLGMAAALREYLQKECGLQPLQTRRTAGILTVYGGVARQARVLGVPLWEEPQRLTGFGRAGEMLNALSGAGPMALELLEWEQGQILGKAASTARPAPALGGKKQLEELAEACAQQEIPVYGGVAAARFSKSGTGVSVSKNAARSLTQEPATQYEYYRASYSANPASAWYLRTPGQLAFALEGFAQSAHILGLAGVSVTDLGAVSYSDYHKNGVTGAPASAQYAADALEKAGQSGRVAVHGGLLFAAARADLVLDAPAASSGFSIQDEQIPFYQIALSGLVQCAAPPVNQQADPQQALLWALETGSALNWAFADQGLLELTGTRLEGMTGLSWQFGKTEAVVQAQEYLPLLEQVVGVRITHHQKLAEGVYHTRFATGAAVTVNYSDRAYQDGGVMVPALGYRFWEKEAT